MPTAIIIGSASGMGKESAKLLARMGYKLGLADLRLDLLQSFSKELPPNTIITKIDVAQHAHARQILIDLIKDLDGVDVFIYCVGIRDDKSGRWESEYKVHQVNALGFAALAHLVFNYFRSNNKNGQIVGLTSILAMQAFNFAIPYSATKFFMRGYMQGLRHESEVNKLGISITEIRPGFVHTEMTKDENKMFWASSVEKAAKQIVAAVIRKKKWAYVTKRWELVGLLCKFLPLAILNNLRTKSYSPQFKSAPLKIEPLNVN